MLGLAQHLGIGLIATGVTSARQLLLLKEMRGDKCEGGLFDEPLTVGDFASKWLVRRSPAALR
jgi:EAL domain-containing protein (putative c-di-GMP-specific phosphodiesterase class I)